MLLLKYLVKELNPEKDYKFTERINGFVKFKICRLKRRTAIFTI